VEQADGPAIRSLSSGRKRMATGHMNKEKKAKHTEAKAAAIEFKTEQKIIDA